MRKRKAIDFLRKLKWWDWDVEKITKHLDLIVGSDIEALRRIYEETE